MSNLHSFQVEELEQLTKQFLELLEDMKDKGIITEQQYHEMAQNKREFLDKVSEQKIT